MFRAIVVLVGGVVLSYATALPAQDVLNQEYGIGVHAYFACDYSKAYEHLTAAIDGGSQDPRAFYFRGLSYLRLGRPTEATADFRKGAELESKDVNRFYNVGKSLERVQGTARLDVEKYRAAARIAAYDQAERLRKARYEALQREESRVLREQMQAQPEEPAKGVEPPPEPGDENPFGAGASGAAKKAAPSEEKGAADEADPFAAPAEKPKAAKPNAKKSNGSEKKPASNAKPAEKAPAGDDPFADQPSAEKKPAEKVPAKKVPAEKKPAAKKPAESKPDPNDPFAS